MTSGKAERKAGAQEDRKAAAVQSWPLSSHNWEGKQKWVLLPRLLSLPLPSLLELQSLPLPLPIPPLLSLGALLPATSPFCKSQPSVMLYHVSVSVGDPLTQILLGHTQAGRQVLHVQWFCKGITMLFLPHHTHTLDRHCAQRHISQYDLEPGKGGTTVSSVVSGCGEMGGGGDSGVGQRVENVRGDKVRETHRSAQVDEGPDAWLTAAVLRAQPTHVLTPCLLGGPSGPSPSSCFLILYMTGTVAPAYHCSYGARGSWCEGPRCRWGTHTSSSQCSRGTGVADSYRSRRTWDGTHPDGHQGRG